MYLSTREMFSWQLADFSNFTSFACVVYGKHNFNYEGWRPASSSLGAL